MKTLSHAFLLIAVLLLTNCKPVDEETDLVVKIAPKPATVLPISMGSCLQKDTPSVSAPSFEYTVLNLKWNGQNTMKVAYIQVEFKSGLLAGGEYKCTIAGDELTMVLGAAADGIAGGDTATYSQNCSIRCGNFNVKGDIQQAYFSGTAKVVATDINAAGDSTLIVTDVEVALQYIKP